MTRYVLDTTVLVGYLRGAPFAEHIEQRFAPFTPPNIAAISVVSVGELYSFAVRNKWGDERKGQLLELLRKVPQVDINNEALIQMYAEIDAYSQGKHPTRALGMSARNMGKNDLWIAATCAVLNGTLLATDHDFDHLNDVFFPVIYIHPATKP